jgi:hypothetical protein
MAFPPVSLDTNTLEHGAAVTICVGLLLVVVIDTVGIGGWGLGGLR